MGFVATIGLAGPALAIPFSFSTGDPDGLIGTSSRPDSGNGERETGDDFILARPTVIDQATFTGLIPADASISDVVVEIYRVFPKDSQDPPSGNVPTRMNSPSDVAFESRDSTGGDLSFTVSILDPTFAVANSVVDGIFPKDNQFTGGEGPVTGEEIVISVDFSKVLNLPPDHYFFVPQVELSSGDFLWLSAPKPIVGGTGPFLPDLQSWIRNDPGIAPDWLRIGTDITHQGPFNAAFSLSGRAIPEPSTLALTFAGLGLLGWLPRRRSR
jgi:PEP-CTERM motif-containing protein